MVLEIRATLTCNATKASSIFLVSGGCPRLGISVDACSAFVPCSSRSGPSAWRKRTSSRRDSSRGVVARPRLRVRRPPAGRSNRRIRTGRCRPVCTALACRRQAYGVQLVAPERFNRSKVAQAILGTGSRIFDYRSARRSAVCPDAEKSRHRLTADAFC